MAAPSLRRASDAEYRALAGREPPEVWFGMAAVDPAGALVALGAIAWSWHQVPGRMPRLLAWASFDRLGPLPPVVAHRGTLRILRELRGLGEDAVYCVCSDTIPGAARWLARLGFAADPAMSALYGQAVYRWK